MGKGGKVGKVGNVASRSIGNAKVRDGALSQGNVDPSVRRYAAVCSVIYVGCVSVCKVCKTSRPSEMGKVGVLCNICKGSKVCKLGATWRWDLERKGRQGR